MVLFGYANGSIPISLAAFLYLAFLLLSPSLQTATLEEKRATRLERIGPVIASVPSYTIHTDMAIRDGDRLACATGRTREAIQAEHDRLEAQKQSIWQERDEKLVQLNIRLEDRNAAQKAMQKADDLNQRYRRGEITLAEYKSIQIQYQDQARERFVRIQQQKDAVTEEYGARYDEITRQQKALWRDNSAGRLTFTVLHMPDSRTETIVPLQNGEPTDNFVMELNEAVAPFVATCGEANLAYVSHYYRDALRYGEGDKPVISFRYNIEDNRLSPVACDTPMCRTVMATQGNSADPRDNPDLTLAGFIEGELAKAENAGDYRNAFAYEQGRREGIVYRLDPYWARYDEFDIARRIFEGEFGEYRNTPEFKAFYTGLATSYSKRCEAHVAQWRTFERDYDAYEGMDHNLDGSRTIHTSEQTKTYRIDARFASHWAQFESDLNRAVLDQGIFQGFGLVLGLRGEMETFLNNHACDSATVQQMTGNFILAANGQPSVQQAGLRFVGAAAESDARTKTGTPPPPFTPVANAGDKNEAVNAAIKAFGGGGLFGEDWKRPTMSEEEFNRDVDRVAGEGQDNLNRAARDAEQSLDGLDDATRDAAQARAKNRQNLEQRLIELIRERNQTPQDSQRYRELQDTIDFTMQHIGLTEEPAVLSESTPSATGTRDRTRQIQQDQQDNARQGTAERHERIRRIAQEINEKIQALIQAQHQAQVKAAEAFRRKMATASVEEQTRLLQEYKQQQNAEGDRLREQVQKLRVEANEKKTLL